MRNKTKHIIRRGKTSHISLQVNISNHNLNSKILKFNLDTNLSWPKMWLQAFLLLRKGITMLLRFPLTSAASCISLPSTQTIGMSYHTLSLLSPLKILCLLNIDLKKKIQPFLQEAIKGNSEMPITDSSHICIFNLPNWSKAYTVCRNTTYHITI